MTTDALREAQAAYDAAKAEYNADLGVALSLLSLSEEMHNGIIREAKGEVWYGSPEFIEEDQRVNSEMAICLPAVFEQVKADWRFITAQQARIAELEAERDAALLLADALDKALQAEGVNDVIAQLRLSVFRRKLDAAGGAT